VNDIREGRSGLPDTLKDGEGVYRLPKDRKKNGRNMGGRQQVIFSKKRGGGHTKKKKKKIAE